MTAQESATARLSRLLTMVPWLLNRPGIDVESAAAGLGVSPQQLESDLQLLFLCGYGQMPDELIDAQWDGGKVFVRNADTIARPLRLGVDEAVTLIVGLRALRDVPGVIAGDAVERALTKLEAAAGSAVDAANRVSVDIEGAAGAAYLAQARQALADRRRLHLTYHVPGRDESTERDVDPIRVVHLDGSWYLEAWCHRALDTRLFRIDRIEELTVLPVDGTPPAAARPRDLDDGLFQAEAADLCVTLRLNRSAAWVADYYPVESRETLDEGDTRITVRTGDTQWLIRLVLRLGDACVVEAPDEVRAEVRARAHAALSAYPKA